MVPSNKKCLDARLTNRCKSAHTEFLIYSDLTESNLETAIALLF